MGLDVTWYRRLKLAPRGHRIALRILGGFCYENHVGFYGLKAFPGREEGVLVDTCYLTPGPEDTGTAYSGLATLYGDWRMGLSVGALGALPSAVFDNPQKFAGRPFVELINFADNEGTIGPVVAAKLAHDFESFRARDVFPNDAWMRETYWRMHEAFEMAADGGAVKFH